MTIQSHANEQQAMPVPNTPEGQAREIALLKAALARSERENATLSTALRTIYERRLCDFAHDTEKVRYADEETICFVLPLLYRSESVEATPGPAAEELDLVRYAPAERNGDDAEPMRQDTAGAFVLYDEARAYFNDARLGHANEAHNFANLMRISNWLIEHGISQAPFDEATHGPLAPADNIIASIEMAFSELRSTAELVSHGHRDANVFAFQGKIEKLREVLERMPAMNWTPPTIKEVLIARAPCCARTPAPAADTHAATGELPAVRGPEYVMQYLQLVDAQLEQHGLNTDHRRVVITAILTAALGDTPQSA